MCDVDGGLGAGGVRGVQGKQGGEPGVEEKEGRGDVEGVG